MPTLVAHRGYAARYPENTLPALRAALRAGVRWLECDVQLSADRVPVLLHDATLERTAGDRRNVFDLSADALAEVSVHEPLRLGDAFMPTPVPVLDAAVDLVEATDGAQLFVEIKQESIERFGVDVVVGQVLEACEAALDRCVIISFDDEAVRRARERAAVRIGWVIASWNHEVHGVARSLEPEFLFVNARRLPTAEPLWPGPWRWVGYDAEDADAAIAMAARGFEFVESKDIGALLLDARVGAWLRA